MHYQHSLRSLRFAPRAILFSVVALSSGLASGDSWAGVSWQPGYAEAMTRAEREGKLLFVFFYESDNDQLAQYFESKVLDCKPVLQGLKDYVCVKLCCDASLCVGGKQIKLLAHPAFAGLNKKRLIVGDPVRNGAFGVKKERAGIFLRHVNSWDGTGHVNVPGNCNRSICPVDAGIGLQQAKRRRGRHADGLMRRLFTSSVARRQRIGMKIKTRFADQSRYGGDSAGVVVMPMTQNNAVRLINRYFQTFRIAQEGVLLPRVEKNFSVIRLDPQRQAMLRTKTASLGFVVDQHRGINCQFSFQYDEKLTLINISAMAEFSFVCSLPPRIRPGRASDFFHQRVQRRRALVGSNLLFFSNCF